MTESLVREHELSVADDAFGTEGSNCFSCAPHMLLRSNPSPWAALASSYSSDAVRQLAEVTKSISVRHAALSDLLHDAMPKLDQDGRKRLLIPIRRACFNNRRISSTKAAALDSELRKVEAITAADALVQWLELQSAHEQLLSQMESDHGRALDEERTKLVQKLVEPEIRSALTTSGTRIGRLPDDYARSIAEGSRVSKKSEATLLRYVYRAMWKTSPFSWYTAVRLARIVDPTSPGVPLKAGLASPVMCSIEVGRHLGSVLDHALAKAPHASTEVISAPDLIVQDGEVRFVRMTAGGVRPASVPLSGQVKLLLHCVGQRRTVATIEQLASDMTAAVASATEQQTLGFVHKALAAGLLRLHTPGVEAHDVDGLDLLKMALERTARSDAGLTNRLSQTLQSYGEAANDPVQRITLREQIDQDADAIVGAGGVPRGLPIFYEDVFGEVPEPISDDIIGDVRDRCSRILASLELFDERHVFQRVLTTLVRPELENRPYLESRSLIELGERSYELALQIGEGVVDAEILDDERLNEIEQLKRVHNERIIDAFGRIPAGPGAEIVISDQDLGTMASDLPAWIQRAPASYACFVQPVGNGGPAAVMNKIYGGWQAYFSRFLGLASADAVDASRRYLDNLQSGGANGTYETVAEFRPIENFNGNVHPLLTNLELVAGEGTEPGQLSLDKLVVVLDGDDRVCLQHLPTGRAVSPLYLGFLVPMFMGSMARTVASMARNGTIIFEPQVLADRRFGEPSQVRRWPRLVADGIALARERWVMPASELADVLVGKRPDELLGAVNMWRLALGLPDTVFLHPPAPEYQADGGAEGVINGYMSQRKPQFVDFRSVLSVNHLRTTLGKTGMGQLVIEECLPFESQLTDGPDGRHAVECILEFGRGGLR